MLMFTYQSTKLQTNLEKSSTFFFFTWNLNILIIIIIIFTKYIIVYLYMWIKGFVKFRMILKCKSEVYLSHVLIFLENYVVN